MMLQNIFQKKIPLLNYEHKILFKITLLYLGSQRILQLVKYWYTLHNIYFSITLYSHTYFLEFYFIFIILCNWITQRCALVTFRSFFPLSDRKWKFHLFFTSSYNLLYSNCQFRSDIDIEINVLEVIVFFFMYMSSFKWIHACVMYVSGYVCTVYMYVCMYDVT